MAQNRRLNDALHDLLKADIDRLDSHRLLGGDFVAGVQAKIRRRRIFSVCIKSGLAALMLLVAAGISAVLLHREVPDRKWQLASVRFSHDLIATFDLDKHQSQLRFRDTTTVARATMVETNFSISNPLPPTMIAEADENAGGGPSTTLEGSLNLANVFALPTIPTTRTFLLSRATPADGKDPSFAFAVADFVNAFGDTSRKIRPTEMASAIAIAEPADRVGAPGASERNVSIESYERAAPEILEEYLNFLKRSKHDLLSDAKLGLVNLNREKPADAKISTIMEEFDSICLMTNEIYWTSRKSSFAHPELGIAVSLREYQALEKHFGADEFTMALKFLLGHEQAHRRVQLTSNHVEQTRSEPSVRIRELQADILACETLVWSALQQVRSGATNVSLLAPQGDTTGTNPVFNVWFEVSRVMAEEHNIYPRDEQRALAFSVGMMGGWRYFDAKLAQTRKKRGDEVGVRKVIARIEKETKRSKNPYLLPEFDSTSLRIRDDITWSRNAARWIANRDPRQ